MVMELCIKISMRRGGCPKGKGRRPTMPVPEAMIINAPFPL